MSGSKRRSQVLGIAAGEFANHGLHGASIEAIAREAGITQAYVFRMFGTKKALFVELVGAAFDRFSDGMSQAAKGARGVRALALMGAQYYSCWRTAPPSCCSCKALPPAVIPRSVIWCGRESPACGTRLPTRQVWTR